MSDTSPSSNSDDDDGDALEYRALEPLAIVSLLLGLASPVAIFQPLLSVVPILGLLTASVALAKIARDRTRGGRNVALAGIVLATFFLALPLARYASAQLLLRGQAVPVATEFLQRLRNRHPEQAVLLQMAPDYRPPVDDGLWSYIRNDDAARKQLRTFVEQPVVRMLLALGPEAEVKLFKVNGVGSGNKMALADVHYTITFKDEDGQRKTLVVGILLERHAQPMNAELNPWRVREFTAEMNDRPPI